MAFPFVVEASEVKTDQLLVGTINSVNGESIAVTTMANVTGSIDLSGARGWIMLGSSVTASAYFGDGSGMSGVSNPILTATQTFSGGNTFNAGFDVISGGRQISFSTASANNIINLSPKGIVSFSPELHNSSSVVVPDYSIASSVFSECVTGSTLTVTTTGGRIELTFTGMGQTVNVGEDFMLGIMADGSLIPNTTSSKGILYGRASATYTAPVSFTYLLPSPTPGIHKYCVTIASPNGGTAGIVNNDFGGQRVSNQFHVKELK